jgi:hypothetical protein
MRFFERHIFRKNDVNLIKTNRINDRNIILFNNKLRQENGYQNEMLELCQFLKLTVNDGMQSTLFVEEILVLLYVQLTVLFVLCKCNY